MVHQSKYIILKKYIEICVNASSIHGVIHLIRKNSLIEKIFWVTLLILCTLGYIILALKTWNRYQNNPTVITYELDYNNWAVTFPSLTLCLQLKEESIDAYLDEFQPNLNESERNEFKEFFKVLYTRSSFREFHKIFDFNKLPKEKYLDTLLQMTNDFTPDISATFSVITKTEKIITEMGVCHAYNSEIAIYSSPRYWNESRWDIINNKNKIVKINSNIIGGLTTTISYFDHAFQVFLHSYNDVPDFASSFINVNERGILRLLLKISSMKSSQDVIALKPSQRNCQLTHESTLKHSPIYSYTLCRIECRIQLCLKLCNCLPYFYRKRDNEEICGTEGMRCLGKYADLLENLIDIKSKESICSCLPNCNSDTALIDFEEIGDWMFGSSFVWELAEFPKKRYRRQLLFGIENVLVSIGGMAGLFLGCGILTFVEIIYFLTIKLFWYINQYNEKIQVYNNKFN